MQRRLNSVLDLQKSRGLETTSLSLRYCSASINLFWFCISSKTRELDTTALRSSYVLRALSRVLAEFWGRAQLCWVVPQGAGEKLRDFYNLKPENENRFRDNQIDRIAENEARKDSA